MADIFISYGSEDRSRVRPLVHFLESQGWSVFWDFDIPPGETWRSWIGQHLDEARCVIVVWSGDSIGSKWVLEEAEEAERTEKPIFPILLDDVLPPLGWRSVQAANFTTWDGGADAPVAGNLVKWLTRKLGPSEADRIPGTPPEKETSSATKEGSVAESEMSPSLEAGKQPTVRKPSYWPGPRVAAAGAISLAIIAALAIGVRYVSTQDPPGDIGKVEVPSAKPDRVFQDMLSDGSKGPRMVVIHPGDFRMGCVSGKGCSDDELPVHAVTFRKPFAIGMHEVTFTEYDRFAEATGRAKPDDSGWGRGRRPVIKVSWEIAMAYAEWLSEQTGKRYRLPSEAEWEYATRAGTSTPFSTGDCINTDQANYNGNHGWEDCPATGVGREQTVQAGGLPANSWDLHEMHGNVWEWVADCFHGSYEDAPTDGSAWGEGSGDDCGLRVLRGGSWYDSPGNLRSAFRAWSTADLTSSDVGFRLARDLDR